MIAPGRHLGKGRNEQQLCERFAAWLPGGSKKDPSLVIDSAQPEARETVRLLKKERDATVYLGADGAVEVVKLFAMDVDDALLARLGALPLMPLRSVIENSPAPTICPFVMFFQEFR